MRLHVATAQAQRLEGHAPGCEGKLTYHGDYTIERHFPDFYRDGAHPPQQLWEEHWKCATCPAWGTHVFGLGAPAIPTAAKRAAGLGIAAPRTGSKRVKKSPDDLAFQAWRELMGEEEREISEDNVQNLLA